MTTGLDMSLDDLIKNSKKSSSSSKGRARGSGPGPSRRAPSRASNRATPYPVAKAPDLAWKHDMYSDQTAAYQAPPARASAIETGTKLYISNLDYGVSTDDIKELFTEIGDLKHCSVHYDRTGRSKGIAEVVFSRKSDAVAAVKRYDNVQLDGKPMKIEIVGANIVSSAPLPPTNSILGTPKATNSILGSPNRIPRSIVPDRGSPLGWARSSGRGRERGRGKGRRDPISSDDLDAELEKYHSEATQIS